MVSTCRGPHLLLRRSRTTQQRVAHITDLFHGWNSARWLLDRLIHPCLTQDRVATMTFTLACPSTHVVPAKCIHPCLRSIL